MKTATSYTISIWLWGMGLGNMGLMLMYPEALILSALPPFCPLLVPLIHFLIKQDWQPMNKMALLMLYGTFAAYLSAIFTLNMVSHVEGLIPGSFDFGLDSLSAFWVFGLGVIPFIIGVNVGVGFGWKNLISPGSEHIHTA
ncbi:MAG: hypothetical protein R3B47_11855 [Bacteroidia bacterium]